MIFLRNLMTQRVFGLEVPWIIALAGGALVVAACGSDGEECSETQTCISRSPEAGAGGEDNQGGTMGASGGSSGAGSSNGGSSGSEGGRGGTSAGGMTGMSGEGGEPTGGTGGSVDTGGEGGGPGPTDMTPPAIVSVYPAAGATGVRSDENIVITFSEPMDHATTEAAFESTELRPATLSWNASSTVLTANPLANLVYAEGTDLSVTAREYTASLTSTAEDESGNRLADAFTWNFQTLRRITQAIPVGWQNVLGVHSGTGAHNCNSPTTTVSAGDNADDSGEYILVSVDISGLPAGVTLESGTLSGDQTAIVGDPYALGTFYAYATNVFPPGTANWGTTPALGNLVFSNNATLERKTVNVSSVLPQHYAERAQRNNLSQYRLQFDPLQSDGTDDVDQAVFRCGSFVLTAIYTLP